MNGKCVGKMERTRKDYPRMGNGGRRQGVHEDVNVKGGVMLR